jgi:hypothetical protein
MSSLQRRVTEATSSAPTQPNNTHTNTNNTTNIEACFSTGLDLSDFGGNINASPTAAAANTAPSASAALAKIKSDAAAKIRREEQEEAALERRVAAVDVLVPSRHNESNNDSKDAIMPRALHPNSQPSSMAGEERDNNFIQFQQTSGGNCDFLSSLVTTHKSEGREISNKSRMMIKSNSKGNAKPGHNSGCASSVGGVSSRRIINEPTAAASHRNG